MNWKKVFRTRVWFKSFQWKDKVLNVRLCLCSFMATDIIGQIKDKIYFLPTINFYFNHSEVYVGTFFLNIHLQIWYKDWKRYDNYIMKLQKKAEI